MNVIVAPVHSTIPARLLNYLTAPHVLIWSAALCSSSVPGIYAPSPLMVREPDGEVLPEDGGHILYQDGSMDSDLPMSQLAELFNVNHFIVSQTNPHAALLSSLSLSALNSVRPFICFFSFRRR